MIPSAFPAARPARVLRLAPLGPALVLLVFAHSARAQGVASAADGAPDSAPRAQTGGRNRHSPIVDAAARVAPAVVSVNVLKREQETPEDPFAQFFMPPGYEHEVEAYGSGFIISADGVVITNQHVTNAAEQIVVSTREGTDYPATVLGEDPSTDIAVLKIAGTNLPTAPIGSSKDLLVGEGVVAIGNPFAYLLGNTEPSVTAGVVSAVGRNLMPSGDQPGVYVDMIQTDAAINPGNSGGPLVNLAGEVVGVNSSIFTPSGGSVGVGFAIPIERAVRVATELKRYAHVRRPWAGLDVVGAQDLRDWKRSGGLRVTEVAAGGPAAQGGLQAADVLVSCRGRPLRTFLDWEGLLLDTSPGDTLLISYRRDGREATARVVLADLPSSSAEKVSVLGDMKVITLTPAIRQERSIQTEHGALIYELGTDAQQATGLQAGDVIFQINRVQIHTADDLRRTFAAAAGRSAVTIWFERGGMVGRTTFYVQ
jgi:serine protease Do